MVRMCEPRSNYRATQALHTGIPACRHEDYPPLQATAGSVHAAACGWIKNNCREEGYFSQEKSIFAEILTPFARMDKKPALDEGAFSRLYTTYFGNVVQFVAGYVNDGEAAKDIAQDVFVILWDNRERIDASYPVKAYLLTLARNRALNHLKHKRVQEDNEQEIAAWMEHVAEDWRTIESREERLRVKMGELSEKQREAIVKCVVEGKRYQAAADEMGISVNSLKTHLARGLSFLRAELTNAEDDDAQRDMMALLVFAWKS